MFVCADMAKHQGRLKGAKNVTRKNDPPDAAYNKLPDHEKRIAFNYLQFIKTNGEKGLDIGRSGCRDHSRHYKEIYQQYDTPNSFYNRARVSLLESLYEMLIYRNPFTTSYTGPPNN